MDKEKLINSILDEIDLETSDKDLMETLINTKVTRENNKKPETFAEKASDFIAGFVGSWTFIISFIIFLALWIGLNHFTKIKAMDPFPFILLNLVLSCLAAIQAPLVMMSQNRQEEKDRQRGINDYRVDLKTEIIIDDLYKSVEVIKAQQEEILKILEENKKSPN